MGEFTNGNDRRVYAGASRMIKEEGLYSLNCFISKMETIPDVLILRSSLGVSKEKFIELCKYAIRDYLGKSILNPFKKGK